MHAVRCDAMTSVGNIDDKLRCRVDLLQSGKMCARRLFGTQQERAQLIERDPPSR